MELKPGLSALVTGGASGIGRALSLALVQKGVFVTIIDFAEEKGKEAAALVEKECAKFHSGLEFPVVMFIRCDVTDAGELKAAFEKHFVTYGGLDICINSAGIGDIVPFHKDLTDGSKSWRHTVNVNLIGVIDSTRLAIQAMQTARKPGVIINLGSASGLYPMYADPINSASKGGVVMFTRSLAPFKRQGIRINVLCPEFVQTNLAEKANFSYIDRLGGYLPMELVVEGAFELIRDESKAGSCLWITNRRGMEYWPTPAEEAKYLFPSSKARIKSLVTVPRDLQIPHSFEKVVVHTLSHKFRSATRIVRTELRLPLKPDHVLLKVIYAGVNASDVNFSSGHYSTGNGKDITSRFPLDSGFEIGIQIDRNKIPIQSYKPATISTWKNKGAAASYTVLQAGIDIGQCFSQEAVGIIAALGDAVRNLEIGMPAAIITFGAYAEFIVVPAKDILPVAKLDPEVLAMICSGLTASISLEKAAQMESGKVVLVTAAAGGTGQFAVQLAKFAGNTVVATCGGNEKAKLLNDLGVDRVIDYKAEDIKAVLRNEFPRGIDIIYESVGGEMFDICLNALSVYGRLVIIGMISQYLGEHGWKPRNYPGICEKLLSKSQTVVGFLLPGYAHLWQEHLDRLYNLYSSGKLKIVIDPKQFVGLHSVADAVEYLHSGKSAGKVVVCVDPTYVQQLAKL